MGAEPPPRRAEPAQRIPPSRRDHVALLLAAGASTRLGQPKQLLTREGESLLRRTARLLIATHPRCTLVVLGAHADALRAELADLDCDILVNPDWRDGLSTSLRTAAHALGAIDRVLVSVCDLPRLRAHHLDALLREPGDVATRHGERSGVPAVIGASTWSRVDELRGDGGFRALLDRAALIDAPELEFDLDTPDDVATARARGWID